MEYTVKVKESTVAEVLFKTTTEDITQAWEKAYKDASKKVKIPGFRTGKAPIELVKKHLGDSVLEDAIRILMIDSYNSVLEKLDPKPISLPLFSLKNYDKEKGAEFTAEYEFLPEIEISKYKKLKINGIEIEQDETLVEDILKSLAEKNPIFIPKEFEDSSKNIIEKNDLVLLNIEVLKDNHKIQSWDEYTYSLVESYQDTIFPDLSSMLLGKKVDEEIEYEQKFANLKKYPKLSNRKLKVKAKILEIRYKKIPDINDEFAKLYGFETLLELKENIINRLKQEAEEYKKQELSNSIIKEIIEKNPFEVPTILIKNNVKSQIEDYGRKLGIPQMNLDMLSILYNLPKENVEQMLEEKVIFMLKSELIIEKIIENEKLSISEEELKKELENLKQKNYLSDDNIKQIENNKNLLDNYKQMFLREKVLNWLLENNEVKNTQKISIRKLYEEGKISLK